MEKLTTEQLITAHDILIDLTDYMTIVQISKELWIAHNYLANISGGYYPMTQGVAKKLLNIWKTVSENKNFILLRK
jgi:hypothetical protein